MMRKIGNIMKHYNCQSFASDNHHSSTSGQSLIGSELEDGEDIYELCFVLFLTYYSDGCQKQSFDSYYIIFFMTV